MRKNHGFSLIELSIALTVVAFLVGSVVAGKNMIKNSELLAITKELTTYTNATAQFYQIYHYWPGDFPNASSIWQGANDGDGGEMIHNMNEAAGFWNHLSRANLIQGYYDGVFSSTFKPGVQMPGTAYSSNIGYIAHYQEQFPISTNTGFYSGPGTAANYIGLGAIRTNDSNGNSSMTPKDAYSIDVKMDDGLPASGRLISMRGNNGLDSPTSTNQCRSADYPSGVYRIAEETGVTCRIFYRLSTVTE